jgi:hypothetical protein
LAYRDTVVSGTKLDVVLSVRIGVEGPEEEHEAEGPEA